MPKLNSHIDARGAQLTQALREADNLPDDNAAEPAEPADHAGDNLPDDNALEPADHAGDGEGGADGDGPDDPVPGGEGEGDGEDLEDDLNGEELSQSAEEADGELPDADSDSDSTMRLDDAREEKDNAPASSGAGLDTDDFIFEDPDAYTPTEQPPWGTETDEEEEEDAEAGPPNIPSSWRGPTADELLAAVPPLPEDSDDEAPVETESKEYVTPPKRATMHGTTESSTKTKKARTANPVDPCSKLWGGSRSLTDFYKLWVFSSYQVTSSDINSPNL